MTRTCLLYLPQPNVFLPVADPLFKPVNNSDAVESKENGTQAPKINAASKQTPPAAVGGVGGGLFDDEEEEEEDDFFSSKSLSKSDSGKCVVF